MSDKPITKQIQEFFGIETVGEFAREWRQLTEKDKKDLREGIANGTLNY